MKAFLRKYWFVLAIAIAFIITVVAYNAFSKTEHFQSFLVWSNQNLILFAVILTILKIIGIVWPPLPGLVFTLGSIPIIGWPEALLVDLIGSIIGSSMVFWLSRKYGISVVRKVFGESGVNQVRRVKFDPRNELEALVIMRTFGGPVSELVSYGAGVSNITYFHFLIGSVFSHLILVTPLFYLTSLAFSSGGGLILGVVPLLIGIVIMYLLRHRYFILED